MSERISDEVLHELVTLSNEPTLRKTIERVARKYAHGNSVTVDAHYLTDDVLAELQILLFNKSEWWGELEPSEQRSWAFGAAKNLAMQQIDRLASEQRKHDAVAANLRTDAQVASFDGEETVEESAVRILRARVTTTPGVRSAGWEKLVRRATRNPETKQAILDATQAVMEGREPNIAALVAPVVSWRAWAIDRLRRGETLSTLSAVAHGAFSSPQMAYRKLHEWVIQHRHDDQQLCHHQVLALGLLDHLPPAQRQNAAALVVRLAAGRASTGSGCSTTCVHTQPQRAINLDSAQAELVKEKS